MVNLALANENSSWKCLFNSLIRSDIMGGCVLFFIFLQVLGVQLLVYELPVLLVVQAKWESTIPGEDPMGLMGRRHCK